MFENLNDSIERALKLLKGEGKITEINVAETLKSIRKALLDADVNYKVAKLFTDTVKTKALGRNVLTSVRPGELMVKIVHDELVELMGNKTSKLDLYHKLTIILISGVQGSGKTTFSAKLAKMLKDKKNKNPILVAGDIYRPAAIDQLKILGKKIDVTVYSEFENKNTVQIVQNAVVWAKQNGNDVIIIDTAGYLAVDKQMMKEIISIKEAVDPHEILFIVDSMTGQDAVNTAKEFNNQLNFSGVVITKLDGDARGGVALSIRSIVNKPIKFIGEGEKIEAIDVFHPRRMADRILGMGDIVSFVEKAQEQYDESIVKSLKKKIIKNQFDLNDFLLQIRQIKKIGNLKDLASMIPGMRKMVKNVEIDTDSFKKIEAIIQSMTPSERSNPSILNSSRKMRIAHGSGKEIYDVNQLIKQFEQIRKMTKMTIMNKSLHRMISGKLK
ncbi:MAG: signal recognition particle protein [Bacteroidales bacterium OttesenSCG-928-I14]|jgi:signal recognition particle subunit SRP54|nr:signal recognition particle protein [Bacteroidales bacterium OttesenSCG-928-I14]